MYIAESGSSYIYVKEKSAYEGWLDNSKVELNWIRVLLGALNFKLDLYKSSLRNNLIGLNIYSGVTIEFAVLQSRLHKAAGPFRRNRVSILSAVRGRGFSFA